MAGLDWLTVVIRLRALFFCCGSGAHGSPLRLTLSYSMMDPQEPHVHRSTHRKPVAALAHWALAECRLGRIVWESSGIQPMLNYFTFRINETVSDMLWIERHNMVKSESTWYNNLTQEIYFYLDLMSDEPDFESYNY
jgi:hypothetical protein